MKHFTSLKRLVLLTAAALGITSCEEALNNLKSAEVVKAALVDTMKTRSDLSEFAALLEGLDLSDLEVDQLTIFAVRNAAPVQAKATADSSEAIVLKRHIVKGSYPKSALTDGQHLVALDNTVLTVSISAGSVLVNGVALGDEIRIAGGVVHVVDKALPAPASNSNNNGGDSITGGAITYEGKSLPIVKTVLEEGVADMAANGSIVGFRHTMWFYVGESQYLRLLILTDKKTLESGTFTTAHPANLTLRHVEGMLNFGSATGSDYLQAGSSVTVERKPDNTFAVQLSGATVAANKPISLSFNGAFGGNGGTTDPDLPELGFMTVDGARHSLTRCEVSYDYQTQLMRVELTGSISHLWFESYVQASATMRPMLNGAYTVRYLTEDDGTDWDERFNNIVTAARTGAKQGEGEWSSGLAMGTQIIVGMNNEKINVSIPKAYVNVANHLITLEYDNVYVWK